MNKIGKCEICHLLHYHQEKNKTITRKTKKKPKTKPVEPCHLFHRFC